MHSDSQALSAQDIDSDQSKQWTPAPVVQHWRSNMVDQRRRLARSLYPEREPRFRRKRTGYRRRRALNSD